MRFGHFTAEALQEFAEAKGLDTKNQDFSEGVFDFKVCQKPNGENYGIPNQDKCQPPNKEASTRPDPGFLNSKQGKAINYDTAKRQGQSKTERRSALDRKEAERKAAYEANAKVIAAAVKAEKDAKAKDIFRAKMGKIKQDASEESMPQACKDGGLTPDQCAMWVRVQKRKAAGPTWSGDDRFGFQRISAKD